MPNYTYDHLHLISSDPLKTAEYYEKTFNAKRVVVNKLADGRTIARIKLSGVNIFITTPGSREEITGFNHLAIETDDIDAAVKDIKASGAKFKQEIKAGSPGVRAAFFWTPENLLIELLERKPV